MLTYQAVRRMALALPGAEEKDHWGRPSFRVKGKIFATLWQQQKMAMVKLSPHDQKPFVESWPHVFSPVPNYWGLQGATLDSHSPLVLCGLSALSGSLRGRHRLSPIGTMAVLQVSHGSGNELVDQPRAARAPYTGNVGRLSQYSPSHVHGNFFDQCGAASCYLQLAGGTISALCIYPDVFPAFGARRTNDAGKVRVSV